MVPSCSICLKFSLAYIKRLLPRPIPQKKIKEGTHYHWVDLPRAIVGQQEQEQEQEPDSHFAKKQMQAGREGMWVNSNSPIGLQLCEKKIKK